MCEDYSKMSFMELYEVYTSYSKTLFFDKDISGKGIVTWALDEVKSIIEELKNRKQ